MANAGVALGTFRGIPMFSYQDGNKGWYFEIYSKGKDSNDVLEDCIEEIHEKLDKMSLQVMREIVITEIVAFDI